MFLPAGVRLADAARGATVTHWLATHCQQELCMNGEPSNPPQDRTADAAGHDQASPAAAPQDARRDSHPDLDGLAGKKPEELTPEELRLMADTMPGEGPGD